MTDEFEQLDTSTGGQHPRDGMGVPTEAKRGSVLAGMPERRSLLDTPQRLGILPTRWFWADRENKRVIQWVFGIVAFVTLVLLSVLGLHPLIGAATVAAVVLLAQGLLEKYVRREAMKRRALAKSPTQDSLPEHHD